MRDVSLSYAEMGERIRALSRHLVKIVGVRPGQAVGLCMDRSFDHIAAVFAVLDAGGIYVPMDPELPQQRLALSGLYGQGCPTYGHSDSA
ncbi:hypothetical protein R1flu_013435 [Riccia fluitans]|uniref:AMP-dependent synthetase/ligase domain-containing protein n=1 Tax=Riccia fluitans TaxID=41844 RepID=A0ABD1YGT8_9MARC